MTLMNEPVHFADDLASPRADVSHSLTPSMFAPRGASRYVDDLREHLALFHTLYTLDEDIAEAGHLLATSLGRRGKIFFCGNGGSAADSQHLAAELTGRFMQDRRPLGALALSTDTSAMTCIANDYGFDEVFARQLRALGREGDVLVAISTSGNSANVVRAAEEARALGIRVVGLLGRDGGTVRALCDVPIVVRHASTARIQEAHLLIGHALCGLIETGLGLN